MSNPKIFIGSSKEAEDMVYAIENIIHTRRWGRVTSWIGAFNLSGFFLHDLLGKFDSERFEYAIFILTPNDRTVSRGKSKLSARDNVVFEAGIFIGRLGYRKVFFLKPNGTDMKIPSDILGLNVGSYDPDEPNMERRCIPFCGDLHKAIEEWESKNESLQKNDDKVHLITCKTFVKVLNDNGDCHFLERHCIKGHGASIFEKHVEIYAFHGSIKWEELNLKAVDAHKKPLHISPVDNDDERSAKSFLIHVPLNGDQCEFEYSYTWKNLFPKKKEAFSIFLHSDTNFFTLEYPMGWEVRYFKVYNPDTQQILTPKSQVSETKKPKKVKCFSIELGSEHKLQRAKIEWQR